MKLTCWLDLFSTLVCFSGCPLLKDYFRAAVTLCRPKPIADLFLEVVLAGCWMLLCCSYTAWSMVKFEEWAAFSSAPMIDFLMANFLTESGGLVVSLSWATWDVFLSFGFEWLEAVVFWELSLSLLLITIVPNSNVSLFGVSMSKCKRGRPLLLMLDLSWEVGWVFLLLLPEL